MDRFAVRVPPITEIFGYFQYFKIYHFVLYIFQFNKNNNFLRYFFEGWRLNYSRRAILIRPFFSAPIKFSLINLLYFSFFYLCKKFLGRGIGVLCSVKFQNYRAIYGKIREGNRGLMLCRIFIFSLIFYLFFNIIFFIFLLCKNFSKKRNRGLMLCKNLKNYREN